ncbi:unnamed protein product [Closterium sp. NIES-53]
MSFTLPDSPQQNGIVERRIGLVMETSPTLRWTGKDGDVSVFRVWGSRAFVCDTSADKLSARAIPCVFLGFPLDAPGWNFYHPTSRCVFPSQDITFDESVPFYLLFPYRSAPPPHPSLFLAPGPPPVDPLPPKGPAPSSVSQVDALPCTVPVEVAGDTGAAPDDASVGAEPGGAESEGAGSGGVEPGGAEPGGAEPEGVESEGAESVGAEPKGAALSGGPAGASRAFPAGACGTGGTATSRPRGARTRGSGAGGTGAGGARAGKAGTVGAGAGGTGVGVAGARGAGAVDPGAGGAGGTMRPRPYFIPLLQQVLGDPSSTGLSPPLKCSPSDQSRPPLEPPSPLPSPSPYTEQSGGLTERREPVSCPASPVRIGRRVPRLRPPPIPGTHAMALRPSSIPLRVPLPPPPESSLPAVLERESNYACAANPTISHHCYH